MCGKDYGEAELKGETPRSHSRVHTGPGMFRMATMWTSPLILRLRVLACLAILLPQVVLVGLLSAIMPPGHSLDHGSLNRPPVGTATIRASGNPETFRMQSKRGDTKPPARHQSVRSADSPVPPTNLPRRTALEGRARESACPITTAGRPTPYVYAYDTRQFGPRKAADGGVLMQVHRRVSGNLFKGSLLADNTPKDLAVVHLYTGEQYDPDLGLYYLRARYYSPHIARFWAMDPFEGHSDAPISLHKYIYGNDSPANYTDPSGNVSLGGMTAASSIMGGIAGSLIGGIRGGVEGSVSGLFVGAAFGAAGGVATFYGGAAVSSAFGVSQLQGLYYAGSALNLGFVGLNTYDAITARNARERAAALVAIGLGLAGQKFATSQFSTARMGRGTFRDITTGGNKASRGEVAVGKHMAENYGLDVTLKNPVAIQGMRTKGPLTSDMVIREKNGGKLFADIKHLYNSDVANVVSEIRNAQGGNAVVVIRQGQFTRSQLTDIVNRAFGQNGRFRGLAKLLIVEETPTGFVPVAGGESGIMGGRSSNGL